MSRETRTILWDREDITYCKCPSLKYAHAHCPCEECDGKAVSRSTEYRHWMAAKEQLCMQQLQRPASTFHASNITEASAEEEEAPSTSNQLLDDEMQPETDMTQSSDVVTDNNLQQALVNDLESVNCNEQEESECTATGQYIYMYIYIYVHVHIYDPA